MKLHISDEICEVCMFVFYCCILFSNYKNLFVAGLGARSHVFQLSHGYYQLGKLDLTRWEPAQYTQHYTPSPWVQLINQKRSCLWCFVCCNYCRKSMFYIPIPMTECLLEQKDVCRVNRMTSRELEKKRQTFLEFSINDHSLHIYKNLKFS